MDTSIVFHTLDAKIVLVEPTSCDKTRLSPMFS